MISNQIMQNTIEGLHQLTKIDLAVTDSDGVVCASTFNDTAQLSDAVAVFAASERKTRRSGLFLQELSLLRHKAAAAPRAGPAYVQMPQMR